MAKQTINWNILLVAGAVVGGLYFWNKIKNGETATDYTSATSGANISDASQGTIRTDLRQSTIQEGIQTGGSVVGAGITTAGNVANNVIDAGSEFWKGLFGLFGNKNDTPITKDATSSAKTSTTGSIRTDFTQGTSSQYTNPVTTPTTRTTNTNTLGINQAVYNKVVINPYDAISLAQNTSSQGMSYAPPTNAKTINQNLQSSKVVLLGSANKTYWRV